MSCVLVDLYSEYYAHRLRLNDSVMLIEQGTLRAVTMTVAGVLQQVSNGLEVLNLHVGKNGGIFAESISYDKWEYRGRSVYSDADTSDLFIYNKVKIESDFTRVKLNGVDWAWFNATFSRLYVKYVYRLGNILVVRLVRMSGLGNTLPFGVLILNAEICELIEADLYDRTDTICHLDGAYCTKLLMMGAF